ncbi:MAG: ABC transporter permease [Aigarchaeota archaeon]|nr:ABC transporter permease [Candidatus Pelearchaeum maunauluense]
MRRAFIVFSATFKDWMRSKAGVFFSILFPIMLLLVFGSGGQATYTLYVQNLDLDEQGRQAQISRAFIDALNMTNVLEIREVPSDVDGVEYIRSIAGGFGERPRLLIIPAGFSEAVMQGSIRARLNITISIMDYALAYGGETIPEDVRELMEQARVYLAQQSEELGGKQATLILLIDPSDQEGQFIKGIITNMASEFSIRAIGAERLMTLKTEIITSKSLKPVDYLLPGIGATFIMTNGILGVAPVVSEYRRRGLVKRLATTPLRRVEWIIGNMMTQTVLGFLLTAVALAVGFAVFGVRALPSPIGIALIVAGAVAFAGLVKDVEAVTGLGNSIAFPMMFLAGTFWPIEAMPDFLQAVARYLPLTYLAEGLRADLILHDQQAVASSLLVILALAAVFIGIGSLATRWREK